jgi:hypothetical protein
MLLPDKITVLGSVAPPPGITSLDLRDKWDFYDGIFLGRSTLLREVLRFSRISIEKDA